MVCGRHCRTPCGVRIHSGTSHNHISTNYRRRANLRNSCEKTLGPQTQSSVDELTYDDGTNWSKSSSLSRPFNPDQSSSASDRIWCTLNLSCKTQQTLDVTLFADGNYMVPHGTLSLLTFTMKPATQLLKRNWTHLIFHRRLTASNMYSVFRVLLTIVMHPCSTCSGYTMSVDWLIDWIKAEI